MSKERENPVKRRSVIDKDAFTFYRKNSKLRKIENTKSLAIYRKIVSSFYKKIGEKLVEKRGGVFLAGFGYFTNLLNPIKRVVTSIYHKKEGIMLNPHSNSMTYHPTFIATCTDASMKTFVMDGRFNKHLRAKLSKKIKEGTKYTNHFGLLLSIFKNKKR